MSLATTIDRLLSRSDTVQPVLVDGPSLGTVDPREAETAYTAAIPWWWADDRRVVLAVGGGILVVTSPRRVTTRPVQLHDCDRLVLIDAGPDGDRLVRQTRSASLVLRSHQRTRLAARPRRPDAGNAPYADLVGRHVRMSAPGAPDVLGTLIAAASVLTHVIYVVEPHTVVVLKRSVEDHGGVVTGHDHRVTIVPDDDDPIACRPADLTIAATS